MKPLATAKGVTTVDGRGAGVTLPAIGFEPVAVVAWWTRQDEDGVDSGNHGGLGFWTAERCVCTAWASDDAVSSTRTARIADDAALLGLDATGEVVMRSDDWPFDKTGVTLRWAVRPRDAWRLHFLAVGGSHLLTHVGWTDVPSSTGSTVLPMPFRPDLVLFASGCPPDLGVASEGLSVGIGAATPSGQVATGYVSRHDVTPAEVAAAQRFGAAVVVAQSPTAFDAVGTLRFPGDGGGASLDWLVDGVGSGRTCYLALAGLRCRVGMGTSPPSPGRSTTRVGFRPDALLLFSWGLPSSDVPSDIGRLCIGGASGTTVGCASWDDRDWEANPSSTHVRSSTTEMLVVTNTQTGGVHAAATLASMHARGFGHDWHVSDGKRREFAYVSIGAPSNEPRRLPVGFRIPRRRQRD